MQPEFQISGKDKMKTNIRLLAEYKFSRHDNMSNPELKINKKLFKVKAPLCHSFRCLKLLCLVKIQLLPSMKLGSVDIGTALSRGQDTTAWIPNNNNALRDTESTH